MSKVPDLYSVLEYKEPACAQIFNYQAAHKHDK